MLVSTGGCRLYAPLCCMCLERRYQVMGFCNECFQTCCHDAAARGLEAKTYAAELWHNYNYLYGLKASTEMAEKLQLHLALAPKPGETSIRVRLGASFQPNSMYMARTPAGQTPSRQGSFPDSMP